MKVLIYAGGFAPVGGIESFIHDLSTNLADRECHITVLCWGKSSPLLNAIARHNVTIRRLPVQRGCRYRIPDLLLAAAYGVREVFRHDVIVFTKLPPNPVVSILNLWAKKRKRRPFIYITAYRPSEMWSGRPPSKAILDSLDTIIVQADCFSDDLRKLQYRGKIEAIPLVPPVISRAVALQPGGAIRVGFLGRLVPQKNVTHLLKAFALIEGELAAQRAWELHLFGDGVERDQLQQTASRLGITERVYFRGQIETEKVPEAIDQCHLFAFSSVSEGQCLAALEILSRGRPIVATPVGAFPQILLVPEFGAIAPLCDPREFARVLSRIGLGVVEGRVTPEVIQARFGRIFSRAGIIDKYRAVLLTA
jgi:glycosyltransferase involved in cell wall biosynthesis